MSDKGTGGLSPIGGLRPIGGGGGATPTPPPETPGAPDKPLARQPALGGLAGVGAGGMAPTAPPEGNSVPTGGASPPGASPSPLQPPAAPLGMPPPPRPATPPPGGPGVPPAARPAPPTSPTYYEEPGSGGGKIWLGIGGVVAVLLSVGLFFMMRPTPSATIPTSFSTFASADNSFTCEAPDGWEKRTSGAASGDEKSIGPNGVFFSSGGAEIEITVSNISDLVGAQLMFGNEVVPEAMTGSRANSLHKMNRKALDKRFKGVKEKDALPPNFASAMGGIVLLDSRLVPDFKLSEWTASGNQFGFGGPQHGYRASLAGGNILAYAVCHCAERDWEKLKGPFLRVLASVRDTSPRRGGGGGMNIPGAGSIPLPNGVGR